MIVASKSEKIKDISYLITAVAGAIAGVAYAIKGVIEAKQEVDRAREAKANEEKRIIEP